MRLRVFEARTMTEALDAMRRALGPDAVIVASRETSTGVRITAAVERQDDLDILVTAEASGDLRRRLVEVLCWHGLPEETARGFMAADGFPEQDEPAAALAALLAPCCSGDIRQLARGTRVLVGPPGAGKTLVLAKLATAARLAQRDVQVFHADDGRAGEASRLCQLLDPVGINPRPLSAASGRDFLPDGDGLVLVDLPGIDPARGSELARLAELLAACRGNPLLVWPAGTDPVDACDAAANFAALGIRECILTRLDLARRLGSVLAAAAHGLRLAGASLGPSLARPIVPVSPTRLATLIVDRATSSQGNSS